MMIELDQGYKNSANFSTLEAKYLKQGCISSLQRRMLTIKEKAREEIDFTAEKIAEGILVTCWKFSEEKGEGGLDSVDFAHSFFPFFTKEDILKAYRQTRLTHARYKRFFSPGNDQEDEPSESEQFSDLAWETAAFLKKLATAMPYWEKPTLKFIFPNNMLLNLLFLVSEGEDGFSFFKDKV